MAVDQLPGRVREFVNYLDALLARLDRTDGWCGVFWQRDPDGMRACLDGRELPPWDVVEALLQDLAARYGPAAAAPERDHARALHAAALVAHDARPGARDALSDRLDVMLREQRYAAERQAELTRRLNTVGTREEADALRLDLAWARDDHDRATSRCTELRARIADLDHRANAARLHPGVEGARTLRRVTDDRPDGGTDHAEPDEHPDDGTYRAGLEEGRPDDGIHRAGLREGRPGVGADPRGAHGERVTAAARVPAQQPPVSRALAGPRASAEPPAAPERRRKRRGGARFAGVEEEDAAPVVAPPHDGPAAPSVPAPATRGRTPRGARFAGAAEPAEAPEPAVQPVDEDGLREVERAVAALARLRAEGRSGEAHALLVEAAHWPAARFPALAAGLRRAGLDADWVTLLWEAASLPADRLVAAADALVAAGRETDGRQILRQGVVRPADEIGAAVLALTAEGRRREVRALLDAYVRMRVPEESVRSVDPDPVTLVPLLLEAARGVSDERYWDLVHALRVAGHAT
ncbi:hypothetical protein [Streptomyces sp. DH24]|uniref:hypothetical protein n=1 Tax=Streptomyces sp. DH24 TaxID=3040123 RepID=UPI002441ACB5|nr:hypothetical protein [Streptomyces sp. DH24]MDG9717699.1 hypothetical protein [Streptomyces sp. DH24]